jgi:hypothetical protein
MKIALDIVVDVDPDAWAEKFNIGVAKVEPSVQVYFGGLVYRELGQLGLGIRLEPPIEKVPTIPRQTGHPLDVKFRDEVAQMGVTAL